MLSESNGEMDRFYICYQSPNDLKENGEFPLGAKDDWLERMDVFNDNLIWLLELDQKQFWLELTKNDKAIKAIISFLQESTSHYMLETFPSDDDAMWMKYHRCAHLVFLIFTRMTTEREPSRLYPMRPEDRCNINETLDLFLIITGSTSKSCSENMTQDEIGELMYNNYLITIPILLDLCILFGHDNRAQTSKIIHNVFQIQPKYKEDLVKAVPYFSKVFRNIQNSFKGQVPAQQNGEPVKLAERTGTPSEMNLVQFNDLVFHLLDTAININTFLDIYTPACHTFHDQLFEINIVNFYQNTIPEMYAKLEFLADSDSMQLIYHDLRHKLDTARIYLLKIFRYIISSIINGVLEKTSTLSETEMKELTDDYVYTLTSCISEKLFMRDYHTHFPVDQDLDILSQLCPEMDFTKCDYLLESVLACFDVPPAPRPKKIRVPAESSSGQSFSLQNGAADTPVEKPKRKLKGVELESLVTEVKDLLPHLGEGFIEHCLEHYDYESADVINAVLEDTLSPDLKTLDFALPKIPPETEEEDEDLAAHMGRLNVFDNDEFDIMTRDEVDMSRVRLGKKKPEHKDLLQMIDDKSHRNELRDLYTKFGLVDTEGSMYDDEYDDTYDHLDISVGEAGDQERRPFVVPRALQPLEKHHSLSEEEIAEEEDANAGASNSERRPQNRDDFVENPEVVRARNEQRRQAMRGGHHGPGPTSHREVKGGPKGQGQDKKVLVNRDHKTKRGNPHRRSGAQRKRQQGMVPS